MPIYELADNATNAQQTSKINELVDFVNNIQKSGTANFMIWVGDGTVPDKPLPDPEDQE